jgi:MFS family permease
MKKALLRNIRLIYIFRILRNFMVMMPIIVPFFIDNGLSQTQIFTLQSVFALLVVLLEVPSGYFADRYGRKLSIVLGSVFASIGLAFYSFSTGFSSLLIAEMILGVGYSFVSGADTALAYDSFLALGKKEDYLKFEARSSAFNGISEAVASVLGGFLVLISLRMPIYAEAMVFLMLIPVSLMLHEPKRVLKAGGDPFKAVLKITKYALHGHKEIKWLILYGAALGTLTHTMVWLTQPYYELVGVPLKWFGLVWAAQLIIMAVFSFYSDSYEKWMGKKAALISFPIIGVSTYILLAVSPSLAVLPAILGFFFVRGVHIPILQNYVNEKVESDIRATVFSVKSFVQQLIYMIFGPLIGVMMDVYSLQTALYFSALLYGVLSLVIVLRMLKLKVL